MEALRDAIYSIVAAQRPMSVRQVFYQMVTRGLIAKTEAQYNGTVVRLLRDMRLNGELPFSWITDSTRWMRKPQTHTDLAFMLSNTAMSYRRDLWHSMDVYVEVWLEKEALAGVVYDVTKEWDVPLMVTRGYPSLTYLHDAASMLDRDTENYLFYFGDYDPSGLDIAFNVEQRLEEFGADFCFERIAVTPEQIEHWNLPVRPTKRTDSRSRGWNGGSVEIDAIKPGDLRELVRSCILRHVDYEQLERIRHIEAEERETLLKFAESFQADGS